MIGLGSYSFDILKTIEGCLLSVDMFLLYFLDALASLIATNCCKLIDQITSESKLKMRQYYANIIL